jgi:hypothetical protein
MSIAPLMSDYSYEAAIPLVVPPERFTELTKCSDRTSRKLSLACDYMDIGGRITPGAVIEMAYLSGR